MAFAVAAAPRVGEAGSARAEKSLSITGGYYANVNKYLHRQSKSELANLEFYRNATQRKGKQNSAKDFFVEADITDEDTLDIENKQINYKKLRLNFKIKRNISALVSGAASPPDGPATRLSKVTFKTQEMMKNTEETLEQIKKADEQYFKVYEQKEQDKKEFARLEAKVSNIIMTATGTLIMAGTLYFVGPYAISYFMSTMGSSASTLASAASTYHQSVAAKTTAQSSLSLLQPFLDKIKAPTDADVDRLLQEDPSLISSSNAASVLQARYRASLIDAVFQTKKTEPGFISSKASSEAEELVRNGLNARAFLPSLTQAESSALAAMNLADKNLTDSLYWKKMAFQFVSEVFFGLTPYQVGECEQLVKKIQDSMVKLIKDEPSFALQPERIFELAFNGKNPLLGNVTPTDLAYKIKNEAGINVQNTFLRDYQSSVLNLTNFMIDRAIGPLAGHLFKFDVTKLTNKSENTALAEATQIFNGLRADVDWTPNVFEQAGLFVLGADEGTTGKIKDAMTFYKSAEGKLKALQAIGNYYNKYKLEVDKIKALFYPPESVEPQIREPFMRKMWGRVQNSVVLRGAFSDYWKKSFGYDEKSLLQAMSAAADGADKDQDDKDEETPPSLDTNLPPDSGDAAVETLADTEPIEETPASGPSGSAPLTTRKKPSESEEKKQEPGENEEEEEDDGKGEDAGELPKRGFIEGTIIAFKDAGGRIFDPKNIIGYASNCVYDTATNMITTEMERVFPNRFKKEEMPLTEEQEEKKKQEQELYEQGLQEMRIMYLKEGVQGDELVRLMREHAMLTRPGATLDAENMNVLEFTFKKIQKQAGELGKKNLPSSIFYYWGLASSISLVNEITAAGFKPAQKGDGEFGTNADILHLDYYGFMCKPMVDTLITYMQTQASSTLADAASSLQQAYRKIYEDVYESYIRKPMMNSRIINYINNNIRRKMTHVTSRVFNRIFLGIYISKIFNKVIDLVFDTFIQIGVNSPTQVLTQFQNYMYERYGDVNIAGIQPFQFQKYTIPTGWDSIVKALNGKKLCDMWNRFSGSLHGDGWLGNKRRYRYLMTETDQNIYENHYNILYDEGFESLDELLGRERENNQSDEDILMRYERGILEYIDEKDEEGLLDLRIQFKGELAKQIKTLKQTLADPNLNAEQRNYYQERLRSLVVFYVTNQRQIDLKIGLDRESLWQNSWFKDELDYENVPESVKDDLLAMGLTEDEQKESYVRYSPLYEFTRATVQRVSGSVIKAAMDAINLAVADAIYENFEGYSGKRRRVKKVALTVGPDLHVHLEGDKAQEFVEEDQRGKFIFHVAEKNLIENIDTPQTDEQFRAFVLERMRIRGYTVPDDKLDALVEDCKTQYTKLRNRVKEGNTQLTYEQIIAICREERTAYAQSLQDKYLRPLLPTYLRDAAVKSGQGDIPRKSISAFDYVKIGGSQYAKVELISEEEAAKSNDPVERYLRVKLTIVPSDQLTPEVFQRVNSTPALQFKSPDAFKGAITGYLLGDHAEIIDPKLFTLKTKESYGLGGSYFITVAEKPSDKAAKKYLGDGLIMLMGGSPSEDAVDRNDPIYRLLSEELIDNDTFSTNLITYMAFDDADRNLDTQIENVMMGDIDPKTKKARKTPWSEERKQAHRQRMKDFHAGKTGRIDSDLIDLIQAKDDLQKQKTDAYHAMMMSLPNNLQELLRYNRKKALQQYIQQLQGLRKKILKEDIPFLNSMPTCDDSTGGKNKLSEFEAVYGAVKGFSMKNIPSDLAFSMPNMNGIDQQIATAKLGCIPAKQLDQLKRQLKSLRIHSNTVITSLKSLLTMKEGGSVDVRHVFQKVNELQNGRDSIASNFSYYRTMNVNFAAAMSALGARMDEFKQSRNNMLRVVIRRINSRVKKDAQSTYTKAKADYDKLRSQQKGSDQYLTDIKDLGTEAATAFGEDTSKKPGETDDQYFERLSGLLNQANGRSTQLNTLTTRAMMEYTSRVSGTAGLQYVVDWFAVKENDASMNLNDIPTLDATLPNSVLMESQGSVLEPLIQENKALTTRITTYKDTLRQIRAITSKYKGVRFADPLLDSQKADYAEYRRLMDLLDPKLQGDIDNFNQRANAAVVLAKKNHRDTVRRELTQLRNSLPDAADLKKEITRIKNIITLMERSDIDPTGKITTDAIVRIRFSAHLDHLLFLQERCDLLRGNIDNALVSNELQTVGYKSILNSYNDKIYVGGEGHERLEGYGPRSVDYFGGIETGMSLKDYVTLYNNNKNNWNSGYATQERHFLQLIKGRFTVLKGKVNGHITGAKTALKAKWQPIYDYYLGKYGTPGADGKPRTEPLLPTTPEYVKTLMLKARAFLDIGAPNERYPAYANLYSVTFPRTYDDTTHFQENIEAIDSMETMALAAEGLVNAHESEYTSGATLLQTDQTADETARLQAIANAQSREAARLNLVNVNVFKDDTTYKTFLTTGQKILDLPDNLQSPHKGLYEGYVSDVTAIETESFLLKQGKGVDGKELTPQEIQNAAAALKKRKTTLLTNMGSLTTTVNPIYDAEYTRLKTLLPGLTTNYTKVKNDLDDTKLLLGDKVKTSVNTCSETLKGITTEYNKSTLANFYTLYDTPRKLNDYITSLKSRISTLQTSVTSELTTAQQEVLDDSITTVKSARDTAITRYTETLELYRGKVSGLEEKLQKIQKMVLRAPGDLRVQAEYKKGKLLLDSLKSYVNMLETDPEILAVLHKLQGIYDPVTKTYKDKLLDPKTKLEVDAMTSLVNSLNDNLNDDTQPDYDELMEQYYQAAFRIKEKTVTKLKESIAEDEEAERVILKIKEKVEKYPECMASLDWKDYTKDKLGYQTKCDKYILTPQEEQIKESLDEDPSVDKLRIIQERLARKRRLRDALIGSETKAALSDEELRKYLEDNPDQAQLLFQMSAQAMQEDAISGQEKDDILAWLTQKLNSLQSQITGLDEALRDKSLEKSKIDELSGLRNAARELTRVYNEMKTKLQSGQALTNEEATSLRTEYVESIGEEEADITEEEGEPLQQDQAMSFYTAAQRTLAKWMDTYHKEKDPKKSLYSTYDFFSMCDEKVMVTAGEFKEFLIRDMAIDAFFDDNPEINDEKEQKRIRDAARKCLNIQSHTGSATCQGLTDPGDQEYFDEIRANYEGSWSSNPTNSHLPFALYAAAAIFETTLGDETATLNTIGVSRLTDATQGYLGPIPEPGPKVTWDETFEQVGDAIIEGIKAIPEAAASAGTAIKEGVQAIPEVAARAGTAIKEGVQAIPETAARAGTAIKEGVQAIPTIPGKIAEGVSTAAAGVADAATKFQTGAISGEKSQDVDSRMIGFLTNKTPPSKTAYEWAYTEYLARTKQDAAAESVSENLELLRQSMGMGFLYVAQHLDKAVNFTRGAYAMARDAFVDYFYSKSWANTFDKAGTRLNVFRGIFTTPSKFMRDMEMMGRYFGIGRYKRSPLVAIRNLGREGINYVRKGGKALLKTGQQLLTKDFWINAGKEGLKQGRKFLQLSTYKDFIKANPGVVLSITTSLGVYLGSKFNSPSSHFKIAGINLGFGPGGLAGGLVGFAAGAGLLLAVGVTGPAIAVAAATTLAASAVNYAFWMGFEYLTGARQKATLPGESDENMLKRVKAIVDNVPDDYLSVATAKDFTKFVKGGKKTNEKFQSIDESIQSRLVQMLDAGEFSQYAKKFPVKGSNGKRNMKDWHKQFTDAELDIIFTSVLTYRPKPKATKGGARSVIEITPLDDLFDLTLLIIYMQHLKYINKGYTVELTHELILIEFYSAIMPILKNLLTLNFDVVNPKTILMVGVSLPYPFLKTNLNEYVQLDDLLDMTRGENVTIRRLTIQELNQRAADPTAHLIELMRQNDEAEGRLPPPEPTPAVVAANVKPNITIEDEALPPETETQESEEMKLRDLRAQAKELVDEIQIMDDQEIQSIQVFVKYTFLKDIIDQFLAVFVRLIEKDKDEKSTKTWQWITETNRNLRSKLSPISSINIPSLMKDKNRLVGKLESKLLDLPMVERRDYRDFITQIREKDKPTRSIYNEFVKFEKTMNISVAREVEKCHYDNKGYAVFGVSVGRNDDSMIACLQQIIKEENAKLHAELSKSKYMTRQAENLLEEILESDEV